MFKPNNLIIEVNHYHYGKRIPEVVSRASVAELPGGSSPMGRNELPCEPVDRGYFERGRRSRLSTIIEKVQPPVNASTKPTTAMAEKVYAEKQRKRRAYVSQVY